MAGGGDWRAARAAATRHHRKRALTQLGRRLASHPLPVARQAAHRGHRNRRDADGAARSEIHAGGAHDPRRRSRREARRHEGAHGAYQRRRDHRRQSDYERRAARGCEPHRSGGRRVEPLGDAGADGVPLPPAAGFRRVAGPRVSGVRRHDGPKSRQYALRGGRRARGERGRACVQARASSAPAT